jgi:hypothetical protein
MRIKVLIFMKKLFYLLFTCSLFNYTSASGQEKLKNENYTEFQFATPVKIKLVTDSTLTEPQANQNAFLAYSISKLWQEDSCGAKGYRRNIIFFLDSQRDRVLYKPVDIFRLLGTPNNITNDNPIVIYEYSIEKDQQCAITKQIAAFIYNEKGRLLTISITLVNTEHPVISEDLR